MRRVYPFTEKDGSRVKLNRTDPVDRSHTQEQHSASGQLLRIKHPVLFRGHVSLHHIEYLSTFTFNEVAYSPTVEARQSRNVRE